MRRQFFETKKVDLKQTYKEFYERYKKLIGSATTQQVLSKNDEAWRSLFSSLKARKEGRLPPFITRVNPPGYMKRGRIRVLWAVLRKDQYRIEGGYIVIKGLGAIGSIRVRYSGKIHIAGRQSKAEIHYDLNDKKWYILYISYEVEEKVIKNNSFRISLKPLGDRETCIDIGINNLLAIYVEDRSALLVNGRPLKSVSFYWRNKTSEYQCMLNRYGLKSSKRLRGMFKRWEKQVKYYIDWAVRNSIEWLYQRGVKRVIVGYPKYVSQGPGKGSKVNFEIVHICSNGYLLRKLKEVAEEYGVVVEYVDEDHTSRTCPICRAIENHERIARGLFKCYKHNKVFNADLVGACSILSKRKSITPSPALCRIGVTRLRLGVRLNRGKPGM